MARTVIEFPDQYQYSTDYAVLIGDINSANHLGADKIFSIMIEAQMRFLAHLGYAQSTEIEGVGYIMGDTEFIFKSEAVYGDQLQIDVAACEFATKSFELRYRISNKSTQAIVALVKAGMVFIDYATGKTCAVPPTFKAKVLAAAD